MKLIPFVLIVCFTQLLQAQTSLSSIMELYTTEFSYANNEFEGEGWKEILAQIKKHNNVLIGEDHFYNEIPLFISKVHDEVKFDNLFCEIDPYMASTLEDKIRGLSEAELNKFTASFGPAFSFYALEPEFNMLQKMVLDDTKLIGTDQISIRSEGLLASELKQRTKNDMARAIYADIEKQSPVYFNAFMKGEGMPYFLSEELTAYLDTLKNMDLDTYELGLINDLILSQEIYTNQDHHLRIQLMKSNVMKHYEQMLGAKNLYKYGATHLPKGESLLEIQDIGSLVNNLADGQFESSLHIMIIGHRGVQGVPFEGMEPQVLDPESEDMASFKAFFESIDDNSKWQLFDNKKILEQVRKHGLHIEDKTLDRIIKGYDYLIIIPEVSPAAFLK